MIQIFILELKCNQGNFRLHNEIKNRTNQKWISLERLMTLSYHHLI